MGKYISYQAKSLSPQEYLHLMKSLVERFQEIGLNDSFGLAPDYDPPPVFTVPEGTSAYRVGIGRKSVITGENGFNGQQTGPLVMAAEYIGQDIPSSLEKIARTHNLVADLPEKTVTLNSLLYYVEQSSPGTRRIN